MFKRINIESYLQAKESLSEDGFNKFTQHYGIETKPGEIEDLKTLAKELKDSNCTTKALDGFYIGYKIPQISKEFDLLRFGKEFIINIELKKNSTEEKIKKQLIQNKYYLSFVEKKIYSFTFESEYKKLYLLQDNEELESTEIKFLVALLTSQEIDETRNPDELFDASNYLVSPFNSTEKFLANQYFLTNQQKEIKNKILDALKSSKSSEFFSITGSAGTGKTLLTFDIAKHFIKNKCNSLIIHCGQLNNGHYELIRNGWTITTIKNSNNFAIADFYLIIIDEAQRLYPNQLEQIIENVKLSNRHCIFSYDKRQTLSKREQSEDVSTKIESINSISQHKLSEKIRTNKEIATFIKMLFDDKRLLDISDSGNIEINYFNDIEDAKNYLISLDNTKWEVLRFTPSQYANEHHEKYSAITYDTPHKVIGQEFDGVAVTIDKFFTYANDGNLIYNRATYYDMPKMLFQNITRARKRLNIVIIENEELLIRCLSILE